MKKISDFIVNNLHWFILFGVALLCTIFILAGQKGDDGYISVGGEVTITDTTKKFIEESQEAMDRIMNLSIPTDEETEKKFSENEVGLGFTTSIDDVLGRRLPDGDTDNGLGWQCSKYTAYLATGQREYSTTHPDYGPRNGKAIASWLVENYGFKYIDTPVAGAIGSGGFNTQYGHTAMYLYSTGSNTAMVNDANYVSLTVATHNMNTDGWVWVVPGDYNPQPGPTPTPTPTPTEITYSYIPGDYFSKVLVKLGLDEGHLWGETGTVNYYTNQLIEQNVLDSRGNVKLYTPFTLRRR